jgi:hypothetical protein
VNLEDFNDLMAGDQVRALVEAALPDGTFRVAIRRQPFQLRLPFQARAGDTLQLRVVAREPQMKFALVAEHDIPEPTATLSETARFVTALLDESEKLPRTSLVRGGAPLLADLPHDSAETAATLRDALAHSGIFYEAHLAQWVAGERTIATLMREPQARLAPLRNSRAAALAERTDDGEQSVALVTDATPRLPELPVHRDALTIIKQQLDTFESRQIVWHGMIWHGQPLDWDVAGRPPDAPQSADTPPWRTRLRLTLPRLGRVDATLLVAAQGVAITLHAAAAGTASALAEARAKLQQSLRDAGVVPLGITVRRDESA